MAKFDVFVKGIDPGRVTEKEHIKQQLEKMFNLKGAKLQALMEGADGGVCIRRGASEQEAKKFQLALSKLGMICVCKPAKEKMELSLVPIESEAAIERKVCPVCNYINQPDPDGEIERCQKCGLQFEKYEVLAQENFEKAQLRERILKKEELRREEQRKHIEESRKKEEQQRLQQEIESELGIKGSTLQRINALTPFNKAALGLSVVIGVSLVAGTMYIFKKPEKLEQIEKPSRKTIKLTADKIEIIVPSNNSEQSVVTDGRMTNLMPEVTVNPAGSEQGDGGLSTSTGEFFENVDASTNSEEKLHLTDFDRLRNEQSANAFPEKIPPLLEIKSQNQAQDAAWVYSLNSHFKQLLAQGQFFKAYQFSQYQPNMAGQIDMVGAILLEYKKQGNTRMVNTFSAGLEKKFKRFSPAQQAMFYAQLANYQYQCNRNSELFDKAYQMSLDISDPSERIKVLGRISANLVQAGLYERGHSVFQLAKKQAMAINVNLSRAIVLSELANDFIDANDQSSALQMLSSAEVALSELKPGSNKDLVLQKISAAYVVANQVDKSTKLSAQISQQPLKAATILNNIVQAMDRDNVDAAIALLANLPYVPYQGVANALVASRLIKEKKLMQFAEQLIALAEAQVDMTQDAEAQAITASSVARSLYLAGDKDKGEQYFDLAFDQAEQVPGTSIKNPVLAVIARDLSRVFMISKAKKVANDISEIELRLNVQHEIKNAERIGALIG